MATLVDWDAEDEVSGIDYNRRDVLSTSELAEKLLEEYAIDAPEVVGALAPGQRRALRPAAPAAAALDQAVAIQHGVDGALGGNGDPG